MASDLLVPSPLVSPPTADSRRRLTGLLEPGRRRLAASGAIATAATAATATVFFAVAAVAQDVLEQRASWAHDTVWLLVLLGAAMARSLLSYSAARLALDGALVVEQRLRARLLDHLLSGAGTPLSSAAQATAVMDEVERVGAYAERYGPARVTAMLVPVVLLVAVFPLSWPVGVLLVLCAPLPPVNLSIVGMGTATVAARHAEELRYVSGYFLDRLRGLATLRALGAERAELERVEDASRRLAGSSMAVLRVAFVSAAVLEAIVTMAIAVVAIYIGLTLLGYLDVPGLPSHMSLRTGLFLLMLTPLYFQPVRALAGAYHERADAIAATDALTPLLLSDPLTDEPPAPSVSVNRRPAITAEALTVSFPSRERPALSDLSFTVAPGELVGVSGPSGAGKSTLLRVLAGDLHPSKGDVRIAGALPSSLSRDALTWLGQRPYLFEGTLAENVALARGEASFEEILDAALAAGLGPVLNRLPDGLQTAVGERGWGLSGGEAHRVGLARTFLKRAPLLLLDEPTAHLDAASENAVIEVISEIAENATTLLATHSPALLALCDRVIELDRGKGSGEPSLPVMAELV